MKNSTELTGELRMSGIWKGRPCAPQIVRVRSSMMSASPKVSSSV
jgi:hypothetical protein